MICDILSSFAKFPRVQRRRSGADDMLLRFGVSNHLSIRDPQDLLFTASSLRDPHEGLIDCSAAPRGSVVPAVVIYGANASGKSNLVHAMVTMQRMVLFSQTQGDPRGSVTRYPFRLDAASAAEPSRFDLDFVLKGVRYHYGFDATDDEFTSEWLYSFPKSHRRTLFEREGDSYHFGRELRGRNTVISELTKRNSLFLSAAAQHRHEQLSSVFRYFLSLPTFLSASVPNVEAVTAIAQDGIDSRVIRFLGKINTGVCNYRSRETRLPDEIRELRRDLIDLMSKWSEGAFETGPDDKQIAIELGHRTRDGDPAYIELGLESAGTLRLLMVLSLAYNALDNGVPVIIDELDASLHTLASEAVLGLFCSHETNPKGAQLIATTHDTNLLASPMLRRDQVWFTEKDAYGATVLFPLTEIRTRSGDNFEKGYLQGRYGAIPLTDPRSVLGTSQ